MTEALSTVAFPASATDIVAAVGTHELDAEGSQYTVKELLPDADEVVFESPVAVRMRVERPTVAVAMKRVVEASKALSNVEFGQSQRDAYEKTFRELEIIDGDDDNEGITVISDWLVDQIHEKQTLPGSRTVRRRAAKFCRANGYQTRDDEWLGA
ncbi:MAG: hypothetical protein U5K28_06315 [Halobacteriales archaeon]|nr:hypothetical protein [Halobacteriales archaeon]